MKALHTTALTALASLTLALASLAVHAQNMPAAAKAPDAVASAFKKLDANGDGKLSKDEVASMPAVMDGFVALDKDKDGFLSLEEFAAAMPAGK